MTTITTVTTESAPEGTDDPTQEMILAACVVIALVFFLLALRWLKSRRHRHEGEHLVVDMAEPESLNDLERGGKG